MSWVNMRDVDIATVADQVSRITGRTLILDPSVKGQVTGHLGPAAVAERGLGVVSIGAARERLSPRFVRVGRGRIIPQANAVREKRRLPAARPVVRNLPPG